MGLLNRERNSDGDQKKDRDKSSRDRSKSKSRRKRTSRSRSRRRSSRSRSRSGRKDRKRSRSASRKKKRSRSASKKKRSRSASKKKRARSASSTKKRSRSASARKKQSRSSSSEKRSRSASPKKPIQKTTSAPSATRASLASLLGLGSGAGSSGGRPIAAPAGQPSQTLQQMLSPIGQQAGAAQHKGGEPSTKDVIMKPGDWFCPGCGDFQFKRYPYCRRCRCPPPPGGGTGGARMAASSNAEIGKSKDTDQARIEAMLTSIDASTVARGAQPVPPLPPGCSIIGGVCVRTEAPEKKLREVPIPAKDKGGFIGKGGEAINRIRLESNASVKLHYDEGKDTATVEIRGTDLEIEKAETLVRQRIIDVKNGVGPGGKWESKVMEIPKILIADTIGPGGCHLQAIESATDCKVRFIQARELDENAPPGKQVALIRGMPENISKAEELMMEKVQEVAEIQHEKDVAALQAPYSNASLPQDTTPVVDAPSVGLPSVPSLGSLLRGGDSKPDDKSWDDPTPITTSLSEPSWGKGKGKGSEYGKGGDAKDGGKGKKARGGPMDPTWLGGKAKGGPMDPTWLGGCNAQAPTPSSGGCNAEAPTVAPPPPPPSVPASFANVPAAFAARPPAVSVPSAFAGLTVMPPAVSYQPPAGLAARALPQ